MSQHNTVAAAYAKFPWLSDVTPVSFCEKVVFETCESPEEILSLQPLDYDSPSGNLLCKHRTEIAIFSKTGYPLGEVGRPVRSKWMLIRILQFLHWFYLRPKIETVEETLRRNSRKLEQVKYLTITHLSSVEPCRTANQTVCVIEIIHPESPDEVVSVPRFDTRLVFA